MSAPSTPGCTIANRARVRRGERCGSARRRRRLSRIEGIIPALESAHAVAEAIKRAPAAKGQNLHREPLRPRRQGHRYLPRKLQGARLSHDEPAMTRIGRLFDALKRENRKGLIAYLTAGDPSPDRTPRPGGRHGARRRRSDRTRRAVQRPDRRWAGDPARRRARAQGRHHAAHGARDRPPDPRALPKFRCCCSPI